MYVSFTLSTTKKHEEAVMEMFRQNKKVFDILGVLRTGVITEVHFRPRWSFYMEKIDDIFKQEKMLGTEFSVRWGVDPLIAQKD